MTTMHADAPAEPPVNGQASAPRFQVHAWPLALRLLGSALQVLTALTVLYASVLVMAFTFTGSQNPVPPARAGWCALLALVLFGLTRLLRLLTTATFSVEPGQLVLERRDERFEIPLASVDVVRVWWLPPGAGFSLRMKSGRDFQYSPQVADPLPVLEAIGREKPEVSAAARHPHVVFAHARSVLASRRWYHWLIKFVLFPLVPTVIMFRANQYITYGGPFGQYQMYGLGPYLQSFGTYWAHYTGCLVVYASLLRVLFELVAFVAVWISPRHARGVRRFVEVTCAVLYYVGIPAFMGAMFLL
ncbi:hypothetical protein [Archangium lipolyticum]|uniref:hypothetical protein n=1 Tax=Archangium lipolyticum TaxID=2970465 RepID=UPI00214A2A2F|nr:hypothetical protein [Archangium lipolyticum]